MPVPVRAVSRDGTNAVDAKWKTGTLALQDASAAEKGLRLQIKMKGSTMTKQYANIMLPGLMLSLSDRLIEDKATLLDKTILPLRGGRGSRER